MSNLIRSDAGGVATLTLNRPEARNALSEAMISALTAAIADISADTAIRAVVIGAAGPVFSAGHDLREMQSHRADADGGRAYYADIMARCATMMKAIVRSPKPVIAAVEGTATAAGCQLVASCDLAIAGVNARFCTPGVHIGLFCSTPMVALSRALAPKHALEMLLLGEMISAENAWRMGLVNRVVEPGAALDKAQELADVIAAKSPAMVRIGKEAFHAQRDLDLDAAYAYAAEVMVNNMLIEDAREGIAAFVEKRAPQWRGQ